MFLTELSIKRPVVASVMSLVLVIFGIVTFNEIPLRELPDVETAKVNIRTDYSGASAKIIDTQITQKIEERVGGTPGLVIIDSTSQDERSSINLEFDLGVDLDVAANDVRDRIARIVDDLPEQAEPPQVFKASAARTTTICSAKRNAPAPKVKSDQENITDVFWNSGCVYSVFQHSFQHAKHKQGGRERFV